jgi:hypothetical protein
MNRHRHILLVVLAAGACAVAIAACGSSGMPSRVKAAGDPFVGYSECMRSHGVTDFPDQTAGGGIHITPSSGIDPRSPAFQAAQQTCRKELPGGGPPPASATDVAAEVSISKCMRAHGVPGFPDPTGTPPTAPQGNVIAINGAFFVLSPEIDSQSPSFKRAAAACGLPVA